jgi:hypothetical protein
VIDALFGDEKFRTTGWMVQQVNEFQELGAATRQRWLRDHDRRAGLLQSAARHMANNIPLTPAQQRAAEVLKRLNGAEHPRGAEIGVFAGDMSAALLRANPALHLDMIDSWEGNGSAYRGDSGDWHAGLSQKMQDEYQRRALERTAFASDRRMVVRSRSTDAAACLTTPYDFVFLDADHSYEGCRADIAAWAPKIKPGGWLGGHDYENKAFPKFGVTRAVNEYACATGLPVELGDNFCWFIQIPAIPQTEQRPMADKNENLVIPRFFVHTEPDVAESKKQGRPIYREFEAVEIRFPAIRARRTSRRPTRCSRPTRISPPAR